MKKLLLILLCLPMIGFGQNDCGDKPKKPTKNFSQEGQTKEYKKWQKEHTIWKDCIERMPKFDANRGTFDYVNGVRYRVVFNEELEIKSQVINLNAKFCWDGYRIRSAQMEVEKKEGRTRITFTDFDLGDISPPSTYLGNFGLDKEYYGINNKVWNEKKQTFKMLFITKYSKIFEESILSDLERICNDNDSDDDW